MITRRLRSLLVPTVSTCSGCGRLLRERRRRPCPTCGSTARTISRTMSDQVAARDTL